MFVFAEGIDRMVRGLPIDIFRFTDFIGVSGPFLVAALLITIAGVFVGSCLPWTSGSLSVFFLCMALEGWMGTYPDWIVSHRIPWAQLFFAAMTPASAFAVAAFFPSPLPFVRNHAFLVVLSLLCEGITVFTLFSLSLSSPEQYAHMDTLNGGLCLVSGISFGIRMSLIVASSPDARNREAARISLLQGLFPFALASIPFLMIVFFFHTSYALISFSVPLVALPPLAMARALYKTSEFS